jgi:cytochrome b involved in lipid metabolism
MVYDLTAFAEEHPAGAKSIHDLAGTDGTAAFEAVHSAGLLDDFEEDRIGPLVVTAPYTPKKTPPERTVTIKELQSHNSTEDCWVAFHGDVFDMTEFAKQHPGGSHLIKDLAGLDGTNQFQSIHKKGKLRLVEEDRVGTLIEA